MMFHFFRECWTLSWRAVKSPRISLTPLSPFSFVGQVHCSLQSRTNLAPLQQYPSKESTCRSMISLVLQPVRKQNAPVQPPRNVWPPSFQWFLPQSLAVSSFARIDLYSANDTRGSLCKPSELYLYAIASLHCSASQILDNSDSTISDLNTARPPGCSGSSHPCSSTWEMPPGSKLDDGRVYFICFLSHRDHSLVLPVEQCLNIILFFKSRFLVVYSKRTTPIAVKTS